MCSGASRGEMLSQTSAQTLPSVNVTTEWTKVQMHMWNGGGNTGKDLSGGGVSHFRPGYKQQFFLCAFPLATTLSAF